MARYDWPGSPPRSKEDQLALRNEYGNRLWCHIADGYLESAGDSMRDWLARLAEGGMTEAEIERRRWLPIGPSAILKGQAGGSPRVAGRVRDIKRSPDGTRIYAASANGGVWYSGDGGQTWAPLGGMATTPDHNARGRAANSLVIGCLYVDFGANADADTVYAGTGEPSSNYQASGIPGDNHGGIGILKLVRTVTAALADPTGNPWDREAPNLTGAGIYRIVRDPVNADTLVAATTVGLFFRSAPFASNADWHRVEVAPFNVVTTDRIFATDAVWVPLATAPQAAPARLFVAAVNLGKSATESAVYVSEAGTAGPFAKISLPTYVARNRIALAAAMPLAATPTTHPQVAYALSNGGSDQPRLWRIDVKTARTVANLPPPLFGGTRTLNGKPRETSDQSWYDMAVAVAATNPLRVFVGGSIEHSAGEWNAALYRFTISGTAVANNFATDYLPASNPYPSNDFTFSGDGVHGDVHVIRLSEDGTQVWVGCDGGVFASSGGGMPFSFKARNTGLAVTECGFIASHPRDPGPVAAGTQDNGTIQRVGDTIWEYQSWTGGDGGGVVYHPGAGREPYMVGQYTHISWKSNGHFDPPVKRAGAKATDFDYEKERSQFYSGAAAVPGADAAKARLAIGTFRLWLCDDWDPLALPNQTMSWRTIPNGADPLAGGQRNFDLDRFTDSAGTIVSVKWINGGTPNGTKFRNSRLLVLYERAIALISQVEGAERWERKILAWSKKKRITTNSDIPENGAPTEKLPMIGAWSEIAVHRATKAGDADFLGSFYVSTTGASTITNTGFTEFDRMDTLWWFDGKDRFRPTGLRNNGTKAPAFAVVCDPENPDIVYAGTAMGVWKGTIDQSGAAPAWTWEMFSIGLPEAFVQDLSIYWEPVAPGGGLKLLRAALQSRGVWEVDVSASPASVGKAFLRVHALDTRRIAPTRLVNLTDISAAPKPYPRLFSPDIMVVKPVPPDWAGGDPTEADLASETVPTAMIGPPGTQVNAQPLTASAHSAFVQVHYRHTSPLPAADISVVLLKRRMTAADGDGGDIALSAAWKAAVLKLLVNGQNATLDDHWKRADMPEASNPAANALTVANAVRKPAGPVDARLPRSAAFSINMTGAAAGQRYLLLAVMTAAKDPLVAAELGGATVADIVLNARHVCGKVVFVTP